MKIRSGFVSNSSSSSFVLLGGKVGKLKFSQEKMIKLMEQYNIKYSDEYPEDDFYDALHSGTFGFVYLGDPSIIGHYIVDGNENYFPESITSLSKLEQMAEEVKNNIKEVLGIDIDVKLITGERCC